jgi:hypothetical protein
VNWVEETDHSVGFVDRVRYGSEMNNGFTALEGLQGCVVVGGYISSAHLCVGNSVVFFIGAVYLDSCVTCFGTKFDYLLADSASCACNCYLHVVEWCGAESTGFDRKVG